MGLQYGMNDIYISGIFVNDSNLALFRYDVIYNEFSSESPQLLVVDYRTGKLLINKPFETEGYIRKDVEKILVKYAENYYFEAVDEPQKSFLGKLNEKLNG